MSQTEQTFHYEHLFDAPIQVVFDYFTDPELLRTWWGPQNVTTDAVTIDLRVNGNCRWDMRDETGRQLILHGQILELEPPQRLVMTHQWDGNPNITTVYFTFESAGHQTRLILEQVGILSDLPIQLYDNWWSSAFASLDHAITQSK